MRLNEYAEAPPAAASQPAPIAGPIPDHDRYSRQMLFPGIGAHGQRRLAASHVAIVGCGATGAASASLLARAGVGTLTLIDRDFVEPSNLQRQVLFDEDDARESLPKAEAARRHIARFNSAVTVNARIADLTPSNIAELLTPDGPGTPPQIDLILDATDNFETRYLLNDFAVQQSIPWIYAAAIGAYAATMNILPSSLSSRSEAKGPAFASFPTNNEQWTTHNCPPTACLACIFPTPPAGNTETCDTAGILSTAVNLAASIQVTEALKLLTGQPHLMRRTLLSFDLWSNSSAASSTSSNSLEKSEIAAGTPRPGCEVCGQRIFTHLAGASRPHITLCGRDSVQIHEHRRPLDLAALKSRLQSHTDIEALRANDLLLRFRRGPHTLTVFPDGRALIQGTTDIAVARTLYARFIGA
jgi:molybdopterin/thiamine biosynthesis adenylyltransferase